jgi:hypothetical protein
VDAVLATRFARGAERGITHALAYALDGPRARSLGGVEITGG